MPIVQRRIVVDNGPYGSKWFVRFKICRVVALPNPYESNVVD